MKILKSKILIVSLLVSSFILGNISIVQNVSASDDEYGIMLISAGLYQEETIGEKIVETALYLEELHPSRASGTDEEAAAAQTLALLLEEYGFDKVYSSYIDEFLYTPLIDTTNTTTVTDQRKISRNVVGYVNNNQEKTIIIGAHYDSYAYDDADGNTGFYSNLLGVATALEVANVLSETEGLEYNIMVAFWGAEEDGMHGSEYFVSSLTKDALSAIALYVNLDSLAVGDNLYIFTNEIADLHEATFLEEAENLGYELLPAPEDKQYTLPILSQRPFMHLGIESDNFYFMTSDVMCANFLSYVWEEGALMETYQDMNITYTSNDNSTYIFEKHTREEIENNLTEVSEIILATLSRDDIVDILIESKESTSVHELFYDDSLTSIVCVVMVVVFSLIVVVKIKKLSKEVKVPDREERSIPIKYENVEVFGETVVLEDGELKQTQQKDPFDDEKESEDFNENPFDF